MIHTKAKLVQQRGKHLFRVIFFFTILSADDEGCTVCMDKPGYVF